MHIVIFHFPKPKNEEKHLVSPSRQCSSTPVGFDQGLINKEQYEHTVASPVLS